MVTNCIRCSDQVLATTELSPGLKADSCAQCHGSWLAMEGWRSWRARRQLVGKPEPVVVGGEDVAAEVAQAAACPHCQRLMNRLRVAAGLPFRLDHCAACQHVWLDGNEWAALSQYGYDGVLDEVVSAQWQRRVREAEAVAHRESAWRSRLGEAVYQEAVRLRQWLDSQPNRAELLAYLSRDDSKNH
ncbi:MAG: hypothetical protein JNM11_12920 [Chitinimonas sp.]|nr:hypothetical protein [Chitinimonas sp.]